MSNSFVCRFYRPGDEYGIVDLMKLVFPYWATFESPLDYWRWKYLDNPNFPVIFVAVLGEKIIGVDHSLVQDIKIGDSIFKSNFGTESATHPNYRKIGVYNNLTNLINKYRSENDVKFSFYNSENPILIKKAERVKDLAFPHQMAQMTRMKDSQPIGSFVKRFGFTSFKLFNKIRYSLVFDPKNGDEFSVKECSEFGDDFDEFLNRIKPHCSFFIEKNRRYLNWRYCDLRAGKFAIKKAVRDGDTLGYVVMEFGKNEKGSTGSIADLLAIPGRNDVAITLLRESCNYFDKLGVNSINFGVVRGHPYQRISSRFGFLDTSIVSKMVTFSNFYGNDKEHEVIRASSPSKIYLNFGDVFLH